jgi:hypothetical protein
MSNETKSPEAAQATAELTVQDLGAIKQIIDVASQRGAFKPNEMVVVGQTYAKLEAFLNAVRAQQEAAQPTEAATKGE